MRIRYRQRDHDRPNERSTRFAALAAVVVVSCGGVSLSAQNGSEIKDSPNVETVRMHSKVFDNTRTIRVLLPPQYREPSRSKMRYPVLYLNEGMMVFRRYDLERTVHGLIETGAIAPLIVVGIDNGGATDRSTNASRDRAHEYLPYPDTGFAPDRVYAADPPAPAGKLFPKFLSEVMSLVNKSYRTKTGAEHTGIGGSSYAGVAALYTVTAMPGTFGKLLLESTPLWIGPGGELMRDIRAQKKWPGRVYFGVGKHETPDDVVSRHGLKLREEMLHHVKKASPRSRLSAIFDEEGKHDSATWARRFPDALRFLFGA